MANSVQICSRHYIKNNQGYLFVRCLWHNKEKKIWLGTDNIEELVLTTYFKSHFLCVHYKQSLLQARLAWWRIRSTNLGELRGAVVFIYNCECV